MLLSCVMGFAVLFISRGTDSRMILEGLQRFGPMPTYLPVSYQVLNADSAFFLKEANQDLMRNSSLQARTEAFFIQQARRMPSLNASYGPLSVQQAVPLDLLQNPGPFTRPSSPSSSSSSSPPALFTFNWKVRTYIINDRIHPSWPKVQVLFYVAGRDWDDYSAVHSLPCVRMFAFHETQEVRGTCRLKGELGLCVAELEPLASWFSPPTVRPGRQRAPEKAQGTPVELYYMVQSADIGECSSEEPKKASTIRTEQQGPMGYFSGPTPMQRIGSVRLFQPLSELRLDSNFMVMVPSRPIRQRETVATFLVLSTLSPIQIFTLRVKLKEGVAFLGARPSNPILWTVSQDVRSEGHRVVTLHCHRKDNTFAQSGESAGYQRVLQVDLEVNGLQAPLGSRMVSWQVEYPLSRSLTDEVQTLIRLAPQDMGGIVPLAMDSEILNTAILTGRTVAVPVKVVTVGTDGSVTDVTESVECKSTDEEVVKVSERCDYVYVNGKETRGRVKMLLNFTYSYLSAQLEMSVWMPRLPLLIDVGDPELSQIKGWRVPVAAGNRRYEQVSEDEDDKEEEGGERAEGGCVPQYQSTPVHVLTHFVADGPEEGQGQQDFLLGSDWQVDVTELVQDSLRVEDQRVARLLQGQVVIGQNAGTTKLQVLSPLSASVLAERTIKVLDDKVSVTELGVQLVSALALSLQLSPGSNRAIVATATTQEVMTSPKQEAFVSCWVRFSDGAVAPLDLFDRAAYSLAVTSADESVAAVRRTPQSAFVVAKGEGQGLLVRAELRICEECQKSKRKSKLAVGAGVLKVVFQTGRSEDGGGAGGIVSYGGEGSEAEEEPKRVSTTASGVDKRRFRSTLPETSTLPTRRAQQELEGAGTAAISVTTGAPTTAAPPVPTGKPGTAKPLGTGRPLVTGRPSVDKATGKGPGQRRDWADMLDNPNPLLKKEMPKPDLEPKKDQPKGKPPRVVESNLVRTFRSMTDLELGMYALVGVSCVAILAFLLNCASHRLCFRVHKTPVQAPDPRDPKDHKHDWVWLGSASGQAQRNPPQASCTLKRENHLSVKSHHSIDSHHSMEASLSTVSSVPERTATLGRRTSSQNLLGMDLMANRSATLLAKPHRNEPLHSPTSKRNQVQFTTFTTLDIKHLAALKKNGVDFNWASQAEAQAEPPQHLPDMPWPVVKPLGESQ